MSYPEKFPALPEVIWQSGYVVCAEFHGWHEPLSSDWIGLAEELAKVFNVPLIHGGSFSGGFDEKGRLGGIKSNGSWKRIRKKAIEVLSSEGLIKSFHVNSGYDYVVGEHSYDGYISLDLNAYPDQRLSRFSIVLSSGLVASERVLMEKAGSVLKGRMKPVWGAAYKLPKLVGGSYYIMNSAIYGEEIERIVSKGDLDDHMIRANHPRTRLGGPFHYADGYVREIFEINFLSQRHLSAPFRSGFVRDYVDAIGVLSKSDCFPDLWEWRLSGEALTRARQDWERSGLVLAAQREPLRWGHLH